VIDLRGMARRAYFSAAETSGAIGRRRRALARRHALLILNLHRVSPQPGPLWPPLHPHLFEDLLRFLGNAARVVTFADLPNIEQAGDDRPLVILSFDDGYRDFTEYTMPILDRFGIRVNQNIIPGCVVSGRPPWTVQLAEALASASPALVRRIAGSASDLFGEPNGDDPARGLIAGLKVASRADRERVWPRLEPLIRDAPRGGIEMMTTAEVREAAEHHEIGVHSFSHESMEPEPLEYFVDDLRRCRTFFDQDLGAPMRIYAFPNGSYREEQIEVLYREGLEHILLVGERSSTPRSRVHHRFTFGGSSRSEVRLRAMGWTRPW
jgi:peptidoglycan/xylan/chitin deacetylase (PgdA/CDA1 family)